MLALFAALAAVLGALGCGSSSDAVSVETGSLSKADFIAKADSICKAARNEFLAEYTHFLSEHKSVVNSTDKAQKEALVGELIDTILGPNIEGEISKISAVGAPRHYVPEATAFLEALQENLHKIQQDTSVISATPFPFKEAEDVARKAGLYGCSESFS